MIRLLAAAFALLAAVPAAARDLTIMSFNVRVPVEADGPNRWAARRDILVDTIRKADPDVIGTQELKREQGDYVVASLPNWRWFGRDRRGGHDDEHMGIFYRTDRLRLLASGDFWLSDTPDVPGSISWGHPLPRMAQWARFERRDGSRFTLVDTHFPYRDEDEAAREKGARLLAARIAAMPGPVILTGDFNTVPGSAAHGALAVTMRDAWDTAPRRTGPADTFHNFTGRANKRIDWIFARDAAVTGVRTVTDNLGGRYPSDHFPVVATYRLKK